MVPKFPWLNKMCDSKDSTEENAKSSNNNIGDAQEGILAAHGGAGGYDDRFSAAVVEDWEVIVDD